MTQGVALAHDYATQRGGGERVALMMAQGFPGSPMYTALYSPEGTFPEFGSVPLRTSVLNKVGLFRRNHLLSLPLLAPAISLQTVDADVLVVSSSGWAHGYRGARRTVVYCYTPARWLYFKDRYLGRRNPGARGWARDRTARVALTALGPALRRWDYRAAHRADKYFAVSTVVKQAIQDIYGIDAEVLLPPPANLTTGPSRPISGVQPGFLMCVARLLPYKNVDVVAEAVVRLGGPELVVVGEGPDRPRLEQIAQRSGGRIHLLGRIEDDQIRWAYRHCGVLLAAAFEDFGLSPLEANSFGKPVVALRAGGFLDSVDEGVTGLYFDTLDIEVVAAAIQEALHRRWDTAAIQAHAAKFGEERFVTRLREAVEEQRARR